MTLMHECVTDECGVYSRDSKSLFFILIIAPSTPPEGVTITAVTATEITVSWSEPLDINKNGIIRNYDVQLLELETGSLTNVSTSNTGITLTSLHPYYQYEVSVAAVTTERGPFSAAVSATTDEAGLCRCIQ